MKSPWIWLFCWWVLISLTAVVLTARDKRNARCDRRRVPERRLLWVAVLGGALAMLIAMKRLRHKTRKRKFMLGLPFILSVHIGLLLWYIWR